MQREVIALNDGFHVEATNVDATTAAAKAAVAGFGFKNHGLVIHELSAVIFKQNDHTVKIADVQAALKSYRKL